MIPQKNGKIYRIRLQTSPTMMRVVNCLELQKHAKRNNLLV